MPVFFSSIPLVAALRNLGVGIVEQDDAGPYLRCNQIFGELICWLLVLALAWLLFAAAWTKQAARKTSLARAYVRRAIVFSLLMILWSELHTNCLGVYWGKGVAALLHLQCEFDKGLSQGWSTFSHTLLMVAGTYLIGYYVFARKIDDRDRLAHLVTLGLQLTARIIESITAFRVSCREVFNRHCHQDRSGWTRSAFMRLGIKARLTAFPIEALWLQTRTAAERMADAFTLHVNYSKLVNVINRFAASYPLPEIFRPKISCPIPSG